MSEININHAKLCLLISRECKKVLQNFLHSAGDTEDRSTADITSLCKALSNEYDLVPRRFDPQQKGSWNVLPRPADRSEGADVFRIRIRRNELCHKYFGEIDDEAFQEIWEELEDICTNRLGSGAKNDIDTIKQIEVITKEIKDEYERIKDAWKKDLEEQSEKMTHAIRVKGKEVETGAVSSIVVEVTNADKEIAKKAMEMASGQIGGNKKISIEAQNKVKTGDIGSKKIKIDSKMKIITYGTLINMKTKCVNGAF